MPTIEVYALESTLAAKIAAIDAVAFKQGSISASFSESTQAITADTGDYALSHLGYAVYCVSAPSAPFDRQRRSGERYAKLRSRFVVEFLYHLRPSEQVSDSRLAWRASADIRRTVMESGPRYWVELVDAGRPSATEDGEWLLMVSEYDVFHDGEL